MLEPFASCCLMMVLASQIQEMQDSSKLWPLLIDSLTAAVTSPSEEQNLEPKLDTNSRGYLFIAAAAG